MVTRKGAIPDGTWEKYDPAWLVALAREQQPQLVNALSACTKALIESEAYIHFVPADSANQPGAAWQFDRNVLLQDPERGQIVLDLLKDGRVGGVEFLDRL
jgi:hypothetical protein